MSIIRRLITVTSLAGLPYLSASKNWWLKKFRGESDQTIRFVFAEGLLSVFQLKRDSCNFFY